MKKLLVLSGKGGTGKTTVSAALIALSNAKFYADCDVDAPNLHLVTENSGKREERDFFGSQKAVIDENKCIGCKKCYDSCRFDAIEFHDGKCVIDEFACEGCGICALVCPKEAVVMADDVAGKMELFKDEKIFSTATLKMGRGTSGKLVAEVKANLNPYSSEDALTIIDGSPGIGCPVIASMSGVDMVLVVAEPSVSGISDMKRVLKTAEIFNVKARVMVNKWDVMPSKTKEIEDFCKKSSIPFVGKIPYDKTVLKSLEQGKTIVGTNCKAEIALKEIYEAIIPEI